MGFRTTQNTVTRENFAVNRGLIVDTKRRGDLRQRLKQPLAETVRLLPSKELSRLTGISPRTLDDLRSGLRLCDLPDALLIAGAVPDSPLAREMRSFLFITGDDVDSDTAVITEIVREVITKKRGR